MNMAVNEEYANPELAHKEWNVKFRKYPEEKLRDIKLASAEIGKRINQAAAEKIARDVNKALLLRSQ